MFLDKIFQRRTINRAFDAIDAGDLQALTQALDKGLSPDTRRHLILEKHTFNTDEFLLSHAVRDQHYDVAVLLLERGANPHVYDQVARNLPDSLRLDIDRSECLKNKDLSSVSFQDNPLLHCYVALMSAANSTSLWTISKIWAWSSPKHALTRPPSNSGFICTCLPMRPSNKPDL